jgi:hypothetical protein
MRFLLIRVIRKKFTLLWSSLSNVIKLSHYRIINTIIAHKKEVEKLKSEISDLQKQLRVLQQNKKFKDEVRSIQDGWIIKFENKVKSLKARIQIFIDKKISINALDMATTNLIANIIAVFELVWSGDLSIN